MMGFAAMRSFGGKLTLVLTLSTGAAAALVAGVLVTIHFNRTRDVAITDLAGLTDLVAARVASPIGFGLPEDAQKDLALLAVIPDSAGAFVYEPGGARFAAYRRPNTDPPEGDVTTRGERLRDNWLVIGAPITNVDNENLGTLVTVFDLAPLYSSLRWNIVLAGAVTLAAMALALLTALRLQRILARPVNELAATARTVSTSGDYTVRARKYSDDELGQLTDVFNDMLVQIERQRGEIERGHAVRKTITDNATSGLFMMNDRGYCTFVNPTAEKMTGFTFEELRAKPLHEIIHHHHRDGRPYPMAECPIEAVPKNLEVRTHEDAFIRKNGEFFPVLVSARPIFEDGRPVATVIEVQDITERKAADQARRQSEERFRELAETIHEVFYITEPHGVSYVSPAYEQMWGRPREELYTDPQAFLSTVIAEDRARVAASFARQMEGASTSEEYRIRTGAGSERWIHDRAFPVKDESGRVLRVIGIAEDITDRKRALTEREQLLQSERSARGEAERAGRLKDEFLATLSHELRTPMTAILGWAQMLRRGSVVEKDTGQGLEVIERNARMQAQIIEDLLDMSRIISGKIRLDIQRVDLASVIEAALETVTPAAAAKDIRLQKALDPHAGPVSGDPHRLQQVVWNLLSNAIKFTPRGGRVQIVLARVNSHVEIAISDTGEGIRSEFLPHLFERFRQGDSSTTRRHGGLGLGLAIVKQLMELHGGTVRAKSAGEGKGSTFAVTLPLTIVHPSEHDGPRVHPRTAAGLRHPQCEPAMLQGVKVLVVDDEPDARDLIKRILADCQADVVTAGSVAEALASFSRDKPDVLVSDIGMPGQDGYELVRQVRALDSSSGGNVPAAALTAFARSEDRTRALLAGYQMHVAKPVEPTELVAAVASLARLRHRRQPNAGS